MIDHRHHHRIHRIASHRIARTAATAFGSFAALADIPPDDAPARRPIVTSLKSWCSMSAMRQSLTTMTPAS
jgi:hypothetical protein